MLDQTQTVPSMSNASKLVSELIETSPITDHLPSHEKTNGVEKETFFSTGVKRSRSRNIASLYNLQLTVEGDCNGEADEAAILGTHRQAPKWNDEWVNSSGGACFYACFEGGCRIVNVDLDLVEDTSPKFGGKLPKKRLWLYNKMQKSSQK